MNTPLFIVNNDKRGVFLDEKDYIQNLLDDKMLFDEILLSIGVDDEELEEEYKSGIKYEKGLENHKKKNELI